VTANVLDNNLDIVHLFCAEPVSGIEDAWLTLQLACSIGVQIEEEVWSRVIDARMDDDAWVVGLKFNEVLDRQSTPLLAQAATSRDTQT
jgi:hypothetical protein